MKNIKNYKMSEINFVPNFKRAQLYSTNQPSKCSCGCSGRYQELSFNEVLELLRKNKELLKWGRFKVFNMDEANDQNYKVKKGEGYYDSSTIIINLGQKRNENYGWIDWRSQKLIIELDKDVENCLY